MASLKIDPPARAVIVIDPFVPDAIVTFVPAIRYDDPSVSLVRDPLIPVSAIITPETTKSPPKAPKPYFESLLECIAPDTKKFASSAISLVPSLTLLPLISSAVILVAPIDSTCPVLELTKYFVKSANVAPLLSRHYKPGLPVNPPRSNNKDASVLSGETEPDKFRGTES